MRENENKERGLTFPTDREGKEAYEKIMKEAVKDAEIVTPDSAEVEALKEKYDAILEKAKAGGIKNVPYRQIINEKGELANPIKGAYFNPFPSRRQRRALMRSLSSKTRNNGKGRRVIVKRTGLTDFLKYHVREQLIGNKIVQHYILATKF